MRPKGLVFGEDWVRLDLPVPIQDVHLSENVVVVFKVSLFILVMPIFKLHVELD